MSAIDTARVGLLISQQAQERSQMFQVRPRTSPPLANPPNIFSGQDEDIKEFLEQFELWAEGAQLHESEWVKYLMRYLTGLEKDIFEAFDGYEKNDWPRFSASIKAAFPSAFGPKYTRRSLAWFTYETAKHPIQSISAFAAYYRAFNAIAQYLLKRGDIREDECNRQFWFGLHKSTKKRFRDALDMADTDKDISRSHPYATVYETGLWVFNHESWVSLWDKLTKEEAEELGFSNDADEALDSVLVKLPQLKLKR